MGVLGVWRFWVLGFWGQIPGFGDRYQNYFFRVFFGRFFGFGSLSIYKNKEILFTPIRIKGAKKPRRIPIERGEDNTRHWKNLIDCCRTRSQATWSPMDLAFRTQTVLHMATLALREGKVARFDAKALKIVL